MTTRQRVWTWGLLIALIAATVLITTAARAQDVELPIDTIYRGNPGDLFPVATIPADPGIECVAVLESRNNESMHPNSDILVGPVTFTDVETGSFAAAGLAFTTTGPIDVAVRLGGDGVFSAGFTLEVTCNPPTTTTTTGTEPPGSTTTTMGVTSTTGSTGTAPPATTTTTPPPINGVDTGGGACADGACDVFSWGWGTVFLISGSWAAGTGLVVAFIYGETRKRGPFDG